MQNGRRLADSNMGAVFADNSNAFSQIKKYEFRL